MANEEHNLAQCARVRLLALEKKAHELGLGGAFTSVSGQGLAPEDMAIEAWKAGYIAVPTVEALLQAIERLLTSSAQPPPQGSPEGLNRPDPKSDRYIGTYDPPPEYKLHGRPGGKGA